MKRLRVDTVAPPDGPLFLAWRPGAPAAQPPEPVRVERADDGSVLVSAAGMRYEIAAGASPVRRISEGARVIADTGSTRGLYLGDQRAGPCGFAREWFDAAGADKAEYLTTVCYFEFSKTRREP